MLLKVLTAGVWATCITTQGWSQRTANTNCYTLSSSVNCRTTIEQQPQADEGFWGSFGQAFAASSAAQGERAAGSSSAVAVQRADAEAFVARQHANLTAQRQAEMEASATEASKLPAVNESLRLDYHRLDGLEMLSEIKAKAQIRYKPLVRFAVTRSPAGDETLERLRISRVRSQGWVTGTDLAEETTRSYMLLGSANNFYEIGRREPLEQTVAPVFESFLVRGGRFFRAAQGGTLEGAAPPGIIPSSFRNATIAALVGPIPERITFWVLDAETGRVSEVSFVATAREQFNLPVPREGQGCGEGVKVTRLPVDAVRGTISVGTEREEVLVLADEPHVVVSKALRCIWLPASAMHR